MKILSIVFLVMLAVSVSALTIEGPETVDLFQDKTLEIQITNTSNYSQPLIVNYFAPVRTSFNAPTKISANETITIPIKIFHTYNSYEEFNSKLEVYLGNEFKVKEINLKFYPQQETFSALFSLGTISITGMGEVALFFILIVVIAILLALLITKLGERR
jgi:hypothetical protein